MNIEKSLCGVAGLALILAAPALCAQAGGRFGSFEGGGFRMGSPTTGAPYSATRTITHVQKLDDGTTIRHTTIEKEARDSNGRFFRETLPQGTQDNIAEYSVFDPVNRVALRWNSETKQVHLGHLPDPNQLQSRWAGGPRPVGAMGASASPAGGPARFHGSLQPPQTESLGSKTIGGLVADGTRTTRVIPAGKEGNDQPITITHESWVSADLKLEMMRVDSDPRRGTTTVELTGIERAEPAAALFQAPAGYATVERTQGQRNRLTTPEAAPETVP
jgi:hypothetical protein